MFSLLLDENLSPEIARQINTKRPEVPVTSVHRWKEGRYLAQHDEDILLAAAREGLTLVTYDQKTILPILVLWGQTPVNHAGVVFIDVRSIGSNNIGGIIHSLVALWDLNHAESWTNRVEFLRATA